MKFLSKNKIFFIERALCLSLGKVWLREDRHDVYSDLTGYILKSIYTCIYTYIAYNFLKISSRIVVLRFP